MTPAPPQADVWEEQVLKGVARQTDRDWGGGYGDGGGGMDLFYVVNLAGGPVT